MVIMQTITRLNQNEQLVRIKWKTHIAFINIQNMYLSADSELSMCFLISLVIVPDETMNVVSLKITERA